MSPLSPKATDERTFRIGSFVPIREIWASVLMPDGRLTHLLSVRRPGWFRGLASLSADAPAGGTAGGSSHADTIHHVHTGAACFADWSDQCVWLIEGYDGWQSLC
jgi:hypothetical protein